MARSFTTITDRCTFATTNGFVYTYGTAGFVGYVTTADIYRFGIGVGTSTTENASWALDDANGVFYYAGDGVGFPHDFGVTVANNLWFMLVVSKATGSATPVAHTYKWTTNVWTHNNMDSTAGDNPSTMDKVIVGNHHNDGTDHVSLRGYEAAAFILPSRVMTSSEIERLPQGNWDRLIPDAERWEFKSGRDNPDTSNLVKGPGRYAFTATSVTGTARAAVGDPPGFRFSRYTRRR